jgi:hypothetical protein
MSGGSYDYASYKIDDWAMQVACSGEPLRVAFAKHLLAVSKAMHAIEWNDSGDGAPNEDELIRACLAKDAELRAAEEMLREAMAKAEDVLARMAKP